MLILTRKPNTKIRIGPDIEITILEYRPKSKSVVIGIQAPTEMLIVRDDCKDVTPRHLMDQGDDSLAPPA